MQILEILFNPEMADLDFPSLPQMLFKSLMQTNSDSRALLQCKTLSPLNEYFLTEPQ